MAANQRSPSEFLGRFADFLPARKTTGERAAPALAQPLATSDRRLISRFGGVHTVFEAGEFLEERQRDVADGAVTLLGDDQRRFVLRLPLLPRRCRRNILRARGGSRCRRPARCYRIRGGRSAAGGPWMSPVRDSGFRLSCASTTMGMLSSFESAFRPELISAISSWRLSCARLLVLRRSWR